MMKSTMKSKLSLISLLLCFFNRNPVTAYPNGAPSEACLTMTPGHSGTLAQTLESALHQLQFSMLSNETSDVYSVTLTAKTMGTSSPFKGFFLQARSTVTGEVNPVGTWEVNSSGGVARGVMCGGVANSGATHVGSTLKDGVTLTWVPPPNYAGNVVFVATVVREFKTYWVGIQSDVLSLRPRQTAMISTTSGPAAIFNSSSTAHQDVLNPLGSAMNISNSSASAIKKQSNESIQSSALSLHKLFRILMISPLIIVSFL